VDAPEGTEALAEAPPASEHVAATVGRPRLSRISRAVSSVIVGMVVKAMR